MINLNNLDLIEIVDALKSAFMNQANLSLYRDIHEHFDKTGNFAGDDHVFSIYNKQENEFYFVISPYDTISKKAPQQALVFKDGMLQLNIDFTALADIRTGAMDSLLLKALKVTDLGHKNILYFGTGSISQWSIKLLKSNYPELEKLYCINRAGVLDEKIKTLADTLDIDIEITTKEFLSECDYIFCHTSAESPVIDKYDIEKLKENVVIASYLTINNFEEIDDSFWDTEKNNVVVSWDKEIENSKDLKRAEQRNKIVAAKLLTLQELLNGQSKTNASKRVVFRSAGTPIQNAAMLRYVIKNRENLNL